MDSNKTYDTVWREKLLDHMISLGIPLQFIRWLRAFLSDRRARVKLNNVFSNSCLFKQGLPQGSVLAPLFFLFYINDLAEHLPEDVLNSLFADDVAILGTARERNDATALVQHAVTIVERWSIIWKIKINVGKCEVAGFSAHTNDTHEDWSPVITLANKILKDKPNPRLLGVILDRWMTFSAHINTIKDSLQQSFRQLQAVSHSDWGWSITNLRAIFFSLIRTRLEYAGPAWLPNVSNENLKKLELTMYFTLLVTII